MNAPLISIRNVTKRFGARVAVDALDLEVERGEIFGLLGHNGAGKSTTIGMLLGQIFPDRGELRIGGAEVFTQRARALGRVGAIFEAPAFFDYLSGERNLRILCEYTAPWDPARAAEVGRLVGLEDRLCDRVRTYSHGMRQRLALAQALLPNPELLILDEPTDGLDPEGIHEIRNLILRLNRDWGLTILFSSHQLSEVQQICTRLAVLRRGKLVFQGDWRETATGARRARIETDRQPEAHAALLAAGLVESFDREGRALLRPNVETHQIASWLIVRGYRLAAIALIEPTLEDFYLDLAQDISHRPLPIAN
ncbi:MAG: ABC transporter ATP-binding protein [Verrucomicrobiae bacterium]|nr:ABC transporter ATP-binding protein [Verrucomicrobiae bacterium]